MLPTSQNIQMVVFDMAGTTVHDEDFVTHAFQKALSEAGFALTRDEVNDVMGYPKPDAIRRMLTMKEGVEPDPERVAAIHTKFLKTMNTFYAEDERVREIEGATDTFRFLRARGIKVALNTGFSRPTAAVILDRFGWEAEIDTSITSDEVARGRAHAEMIRVLMERFDLQESHAVAKVGDTPSDLLEGASADCGWNIGVTAGSHSADELREHPHTHLIESVKDLPGLFESSESAGGTTGDILENGASHA